MIKNATQNSSATDTGHHQQTEAWPFVFCLTLFFLSGAAGLVYQVLWVRQFTLVLGGSAHAVTIVLTAFMFGLGLGAWLLGTMADRLDGRRLVRAYIGIEVGIGLYALLLPSLILGMEWGFVAFYQAVKPEFWLFNGTRLCLSFLLLAVPTTLIGGTLPILCRLVILQRQGLADRVSALYGANTLGAIAGVVATGYVLLPFLGVSAATKTAVGLNMLVAAGLWMLNRAMPTTVQPGNPSPRLHAHRTPAPAMTAVVLGFGLSGTATMLYEVAWTRALSLVVGTTTYAFTTMLSVILLGIALGSLLYPFIPRRIPRTALFVGLQLVVAFSALASIPAFSSLPFVYLSLSETLGDSWTGLQYLRFLLAGLVMLVPTTAMGAMFPSVSDMLVDHAGHIGSRLGKAYALNTLGATIGAALGGLFLIPAIGLQGTILAAMGLNLTVAVTVLVTGTKPLGPRLAAAGGVVLAAALLTAVIPPWSPKAMSSGTYVYASRYLDMAKRYMDEAAGNDMVPVLSRWDIWKLAMERFDLLYHRTGAGATVSVMERPDGVRFLTINGKTDASNGYKSDMLTQVMIGQFPMLFHPDPQHVLVVGLGSGVTAGSVLTHPARAVDCVEISRAVVDAARYFANDNHHALDDPRMHVIRRDARNHLLTSRTEYDVIVSQPSNPWISGEANLFSLEWYRLVRDRLGNGGLLVQWLPTYSMSEKDLKIILHTMRTVFPNVSLWTSGAVGDVIILASKGMPLRIDYAQVIERGERPEVAGDLARLGMTPARVPIDLFIMNRDELAAYLHGNSPLPLNTDDNPLIEFGTPKRMAENRTVARFMIPENLRGRAESLAEMIVSINPEVMTAIAHTQDAPNI